MFDATIVKSNMIGLNKQKFNQLNALYSEKLYMTMADYLVSEGYRDLGYVYVNMDNCWATKNRDKNGTLVADPVRFPSGIKALADYVRGLHYITVYYLNL